MLYKSLTLLLVATIATQTYALTGSQVIEIVAGMMDGVIHKDDLAELQACMQGADQLTDEFDTAVSDFEQGGITGYTSAIEVVAQIINQLPQDLNQCTSIDGDLSKLGDWAKIFLQPTVLLERVSYNLLVHFSEINGDIQTALTDYKSQQFFNFGEVMGEALVLATQE
ncbi:UNKNOWN [Stylonychia lemnae]|uniref:Uncharacterized protein n=1 Tax=Stylonychia lemnae TaxID=5949 RepID=A0A078AK41_STYLE|nr:UNKNOWN [Stylonychia lemnae]|eukprot:CDW82544.1 UNKNOWN [Stylonychia lemnae]